MDQSCLGPSLRFPRKRCLESRRGAQSSKEVRVLDSSIARTSVGLETHVLTEMKSVLGAFCVSLLTTQTVSIRFMTHISEAQRIYKDLASMEHTYCSSDMRGGLIDRINCLSSDQRTVLGLLHVEELTCEQVASLMGLRVEAIHLLRASALETLNSQIEALPPRNRG